MNGFWLVTLALGYAAASYASEPPFSAVIWRQGHAGASSLSLECEKAAQDCRVVRKKNGAIVVNKPVTWESAREIFEDFNRARLPNSPKSKNPKVTAAVFGWRTSYKGKTNSGALTANTEVLIPKAVSQLDANVSSLAGW